MAEHNSSSCAEPVSSEESGTEEQADLVTILDRNGVPCPVQSVDPVPPQNTVPSVTHTGDVCSRFRSWITLRNTTQDLKIFQLRNALGTVKGLGTTQPIWVPVADTNMMCASVRGSDIVDQNQLVTTTQLVLGADQIRDDAPGQVDFWPARKFSATATTTSSPTAKPTSTSTSGKDKGRWEVVDRWKSATVATIKTEITSRLQCSHFGAAARFGRPALRALVTSRDYAKVAAVAHELGLQFARVTAPNMSAAKLTVKAVTGTNEALAHVARTATDFIVNEFQATLGRVDDSPGSVSVVVYTDRKLTAVDAFSYLTEDGFRVAFAPSAGHDCTITNKEIDDNLATFPQPPTQVIIPAVTTGTENNGAQVHAVAVGEGNIENNTHEQAITATKKTYKSWSALGQSQEVVKQAMQAMKDLYTQHIGTPAAREHYALWANTCPTPAAVANAASLRGLNVDRLAHELRQDLPPAKLAAVAEERSRQAHNPQSQPARRSYADAARRRPADKQVTHRK